MNPVRQFEIVIEIAKYGSISKAAHTLHISQPTLSKYLAKLEEELNANLFDRTTIPLQPTEYGTRYILAGKRILDTYQKLEKEFKKIKNNSTPVLKLGISPSRAHYILPEITKLFYNINSNTKLVVKEKTIAQLNSDLLQGELDLIISLFCDGTKQFNSIHLFSEKILLAVPNKYAKYTTNEILAECPFINTGSGLNISNLLINILYKYGTNKPIMEVQSIESAISMANQGIGAALVPSYIKNHGHYDNVTYIELPEDLDLKGNFDLNRQICVFYNKNKELTPSEIDFINICKNIQF